MAVGFLIERTEDKEMKKTQKWFYSLAAAALIFSGCSAKPQEKPADGAMTAGTYTATSSGYAGEMEVSVTVDEEKILTIEIGRTTKRLVSAVWRSSSCQAKSSTRKALR